MALPTLNDELYPAVIFPITVRLVYVNIKQPPAAQRTAYLMHNDLHKTLLAFSWSAKTRPIILRRPPFARDRSKIIAHFPNDL